MGMLSGGMVNNAMVLGLVQHLKSIEQTNKNADARLDLILKELQKLNQNLCEQNKK